MILFFIKRSIQFSIPALIFIFSFAGCNDNISVISRPLLGTIVTITIADDAGDIAGDFEAAFSEIERVQKSFNTYDPESEISIINKTAPDRPCKVSDVLFSLISDSLKVSKVTNGAFDITFASIGKLWDFSSHSREDFMPPEDKTIKGLLPFISYKNVILDSNARTVRFLKKGTRIGLGGIAKGYATGRAISALKGRHVKGAIVACAGDIQVLGNNNGKQWKLGIKDPRGDSVLGTVDMNDGESVATSGDYERFRIVNGKRYHHIIDPAKGFPADSGLISVTVFCSDPEMADAYGCGFLFQDLINPERYWNL